MPAVPAQVVSFDVESSDGCVWDFLTIGGSAYCGGSGPTGVVVDHRRAQTPAVSFHDPVHMEAAFVDQHAEGRSRNAEGSGVDHVSRTDPPDAGSM